MSINSHNAPMNRTDKSRKAREAPAANSSPRQRSDRAAIADAADVSTPSARMQLVRKTFIGTETAFWGVVHTAPFVRCSAHFSAGSYGKVVVSPSLTAGDVSSVYKYLSAGGSDLPNERIAGECFRCECRAVDGSRQCRLRGSRTRRYASRVPCAKA